MKKIFALGMALCMTFALAACSTSSSTAFTFEVSTGDDIRVELDTSTGYSQTSDVPFSILNEDDEEVAFGTFMNDGIYEEYLGLIEDDDNAVVIDEGKTDEGHEYIFYSVENEDFVEYDYIINLANCETDMAIGCTVSEDVAREVFELLTIEAK